MAKQALNGRERQKLQRTYKMWVSSVDFTCKMFIFRNIYHCESTIFRAPFTIPYNVLKFSTVPLVT